MKKKKFKPAYLLTPYLVYEDERLQPADKAVYSVIYYFEKMKEGICKASNRTIAEIAMVSVGTVRNSISKLNKCGLVNVVYKDEEKNLRERIDCLVDFAKVSPKNDGCNEMMTGVSSNDDGGVSSDDAQINKSNLINKNDNIAKETFAEGKNQINQILEIFYEYNPMINFGNKTQRKAIQDMINKIGFDKLKEITNLAIQAQSQKYAPRITTPLQLKNKFGDLKTFIQGKISNQPKIIRL